MIVSKDPSPATPAISVAGVVTDTEGEPLGGMHVVLKARLEASHHYAWELGHNRDVLARTSTTADGRFEFAGIGIPPRMTSAIAKLKGGEQGAQLLVWGEGKALKWEPIVGFQSADRNVQLQPEADVSGTVVNTEGVPVREAEIKLIGLTKKTRGIKGRYDEPGDLQLYLSDIRFWTRVREGRFNVSNMPSGYVVQLACRTDDGGLGGVIVKTGDSDLGAVTFAHSRSSERSIQKSPIKLSVTEGIRLPIKVVDHTGKPVTSGGLGATGPARSISYTAEIGADGIGVLTVNQWGTYRVAYVADPLSPAVGLSQYVDVQEGESPPVVVMRVPSFQVLQGTVIDRKTGSPILGAYVSGSRKFDADSTDPQPTNSMAVTDKNGVFRLPVIAGENTLSWRHKIDGYFVGRWSEPGSMKVKVTVPRSGVPDNVVIRVGRGLTIRGIVRSEHGQPVSGVRVFAKNDGDPYRQSVVITDKNGVYRFDGFSPYAAVRIAAWNQSGAAVAQIAASPDHPAGESRLETTNLNLTAGTTVTGRVVRDGKPVVGIGVKLKNAPPHIPGQGTRFLLLSETTTDAEGRYRLVGLRKGEQYALEVETSGNLEVRDWHYQSGYSHTVRSDNSVIEVPDARLVSNGQQLRGVVVDPDGKPVTGIQVNASLASGGILSRPRSGSPPWTQTDEQGRFVLTNLPEEKSLCTRIARTLAGGFVTVPVRLLN